MNIRILCVGKLKDKFYIEAAAEYSKRLGRYCQIEICEAPDEKTPDSYSDAEARQAMDKEGERLLARIRPGEHVIALCIDGKRMDSVKFSERLTALFDDGRQTVDFVIGGSLGLSQAVLARADERMSMSDMTFPHRLARVMLLEQIYRAFKIRAGETYHK